MIVKFALLIITCLGCVTCYSIGESYFKDLAGKAGPICSDGKCVCNQGETCCSQNNKYQCCKIDSGVCCSGSNDCCLSFMPLCTQCTAGKIECCFENENKCCGGTCCQFDTFPGCTFGTCNDGTKKRRSVPSIPATTLLQPNGPEGKCIEVTLSPEQTTRPFTDPSTPPTTITTTSRTTTTTTRAGGTTTTIFRQEKDCAGWRNAGATTSGIYTIITSRGSLQVYCDMTTDGGGWIVFQRRQDGTVSFMQGWDSYADGFGNLNGEFWLGNSHISDISTSDTQTMRVELTDCQGNTYYEVYPQFFLNNEETNFIIDLSGTPTGTAGDSLMFQCPGHLCQNGMPFTTYDRNHNQGSIGNCAFFQQGAWWYNACGASDLNGLYYPSCTCTSCNPYQNGIFWHTYKNGAGEGYSFKKTEIKIRPVSFIPSL